MNHRGNAAAIGKPDTLERALHRSLRGQVDADAFRGGRRRPRGNLVKAHQRKTPGELVDQGRADEAGAAGDDDDLLLRHARASSARSRMMDANAAETGRLLNIRVSHPLPTGDRPRSTAG